MILDPVFEHSQGFLKYKRQDYRRYFLSPEYRLSEPFSIFVGQRGIGKTTLMVQHLLDFVDNDFFTTKALYVQADHFSLGELSLYEIAKEFQLMGGRFIAFDEIHKYQNWSKELKSICDSFQKLKIIASGSSALEIHKGSHDLSRRAIVYKILGMSFREYLELRLSIKLPHYSLSKILKSHQTLANELLAVIKAKDEAILRLFHQYLDYGYYPYFYEFNDPDKFNITLEQNIHTTLESDLMAIYPKLTNYSISKMKHLLLFIASNAPYCPNWHNLRELLEVGDERTLKNYFKYLEDAGLVMAIYKSSKQLSKQLNPEKIYLQNPNLINAMAKGNKNIGTVREVFFYNMLSKDHILTLPLNGDFLVDDEFVFEIGGKKKSFNQIKDQQKAYVVSDDIDVGVNNKIPLWIFGFLY